MTRVRFFRQLVGPILLLVTLTASACGPSPEPTGLAVTPGETLALAPTLPPTGAPPTPIPPTTTDLLASPTSPSPTVTLALTYTPRPTEPPPTPTPTEATPQAITPENAGQVALLDVLGQGPLSGMALLPGGQTVAAAYQTGLYLYDAETLAERDFVAVEGSKTGLVAHPDGRYLVVTSGEGLQIWDLEARRVAHELEGSVSLVAFDAHGHKMATMGDELKDGTWQSVVTVWDVAPLLDGGQGEIRPLLRLEGLPGGVSGLALSPDGGVLVTGGGRDYNDPADSPLRLWDTATGQPLPLPGDLAGAPAYLKNLAFSPSGRLLVASDISNIHVWDVESGVLRHVLEQDQGYVTALAFDPQGRHLASGTVTGALHVWDLDDGALLTVATQHSADVLSLAFLPPEATADGGRVLLTATARDGVQVLDLTRAERLAARPPQGPTEGVTALAYSPGGDLLAAASSDETIWLWDASTGLSNTTAGKQPPRRLTAPRLAGSSACACYWSLAFSPDGKTLATGSTDAAVRIWDVATGDLLDVLEAPSGLVGSLAFSPNGDLLAAGDYDGNVLVWDLSSGLAALPVLRLANPPTALSVSFSPDGRTLATGSGFGTLRLWDVGTGDLVREIDVAGSNASRAAFSPSGDLLVSISSGFEPDYAVRLWDTGSGDLLRTLEGHKTDVTDLAFSSGGLLLATSDQEGSVWLWDLAAGDALRTLEQGNWVQSVAFHPGGTRLATGSYDALIRIWGVP